MVLPVLASVAVMALPMPGDAEAEAFTQLFERGEALYSKGDYGAAITLFREADRLKVTPEVAFDLARSYEKLGDAAFTTLYDRLYLARSPDASDAKDLSVRIWRTIDKQEDDGRGYLEVFSPGALSLSIGGRFFPAPPAALFLPAGEHVVQGAFPSGVKRLKVKVVPGQLTVAWFEPLPPPLTKAEAEVPVAAAETRQPAQPPSPSNGLRVLSLIISSIGASALIAGLVTGGLANADAARAQDKALSIREAKLAAEASNGKATAANVLFVAGGALAAVGGVLFIVALPGPGEPALR